MKFLARWLGVPLLVLFAAIQLVPYGRDHANPPVTKEPAWDSARTRELAVRACFDCHSNQTVWPWYTLIAPVSWLAQRDVEKGREELNYSEWDRPGEEADESAETVIEEEMPPWYYTLLQPRSRLSYDEEEELIRGFEATFGKGGGENEKGDEKEERENEEEDEKRGGRD